MEWVSLPLRPYTWVATASVVKTHMLNMANQLKNWTSPSWRIVLGMERKSRAICTTTPWRAAGLDSGEGGASLSEGGAGLYFLYSSGGYSREKSTVTRMQIIKNAAPK